MIKAESCITSKVYPAQPCPVYQAIEMNIITFKPIHTFQVLLCLISIACFTSLAAEQPQEKFRPGELWMDNNGVHINAHGGGLLYHEGTYYWYGEHKVAGSAGNKAMVGVHCYSSQDLLNWTDEGVALPVSEEPDSEIEKGCIIERPKVIFNQKTGKFVMWFHLELKGQGYLAARSGVAVSNTPTGPFTYLRSVRPNEGVWPLNANPRFMKVLPLDEISHKRSNYRMDVVSENILSRDFPGGQMARDMNLFVDDDGKAYHIYSSEENSALHISLLSDDFLSHAGTYVRIFPGRWMEAPAMFKRDGIYYLIASGCSGWAPNQARLAMAESIFGPWLELDCPCYGVNPQNGLGPEKTFGGQSTYVLKVHGKEDAYIAMFDQCGCGKRNEGNGTSIEIERSKEVVRSKENFSIPQSGYYLLTGSVDFSEIHDQATSISVYAGEERRILYKTEVPKDGEVETPLGFLEKGSSIHVTATNQSSSVKFALANCTRSRSVAMAIARSTITSRTRSWTAVATGHCG